MSGYNPAGFSLGDCAPARRNVLIYLGIPIRAFMWLILVILAGTKIPAKFILYGDSMDA